MIRERTTTLIETGDLYATPGSRDWAIAVRMEMRRCLDGANVDHDGLNGFVRLFAEFEGWRVLGYESLEAFLADKSPNGLEITAKTLQSWVSQFIFIVRPLEAMKRQWERASEQERDDFLRWANGKSK